MTTSEVSQESTPKNAQNGNERQKRESSNASTIVVLALASVGMAMGLFAGLSESPVVATLLPLLFATIGGSTGLYVFRADPADQKHIARLRLTARAVLAMTISCVLFAMYGIAIREDLALLDFFPRWTHDPRSGETLVSDGSSESDIQLALLSAKLRLLGVNDQDERRIVEKAKLEMSTFSDANVAPDMRALLDKVLAAHAPLTEFLAHLEKQGKWRMDGHIQEDFEMHPAVDLLIRQLRSTEEFCKRWLATDTSGNTPEIPRRALASVVHELKTVLERGAGKPTPPTRRPRPKTMEELSIYDWLADQEDEYEVNYFPILELERTVYKLNRSYGYGDWIGTNEDGEDLELAEAIDKFLLQHAATKIEGSADKRKRRRPHMKP